jgi:hypothetical protein
MLPPKASCTIERRRFVEIAPGEFEEKRVQRWEPESLPLRIDVLTLDLEESVLHLGLRARSWSVARDPRGRYWKVPTAPARRVITLPDGATARLVANRRRTGHWNTEWAYIQQTFNVAFMDEVLGDVFVSRPPDESFTQEARLYNAGPIGSYNVWPIGSHRPEIA